MSESRDSGTVSSFDERRGLGEITDDAGQVWPFHCAEISDGSRHIAVGQQVSFITKFHVARVEAFEVTPL